MIKSVKQVKYADSFLTETAIYTGGGGTIGTYVAKELLEMGCSVDIICLEDYTSDNEKLRYFKSNITLDFLKGFLADKHYNGILDLLHHRVPEDYIDFHMVMAPKTDHEIFFSSIRALGDAQHPITETAPTILDLVDTGDLPMKALLKTMHTLCQNQDAKDICVWFQNIKTGPLYAQ